jgi:hypothetical protein
MSEQTVNRDYRVMRRKMGLNQPSSGGREGDPIRWLPL